jgi:hypothetical protein
MLPAVPGRAVALALAESPLHGRSLIPAATLTTAFGPEPPMLGTILLVIVVLALIGIIPAWPHSRSWGYGPSGALGVVMIILLVLVLTGRM